ncbi:hypothetical protein MJO28_001860 [Puccinia striiformis f. sp. tritici]|uniref:Uncharacterized protein n=1 Tax=Puccinia striiformis f. sp. tritici TaxID=168172 RepID=A0ACC0EW82_9BASI|nr:hypothetical protein MJO28_001860 [Puccinia striiformis f. sp. tritici]
MNFLSAKRHSSVSTSRPHLYDRGQYDPATPGYPSNQQPTTKPLLSLTRKAQQPPSVDSLGHLRRRSEVSLVHPVMSRAIQDLHNQPTGWSPPVRRLSTHFEPNSYHPIPPVYPSSTAYHPKNRHLPSSNPKSASSRSSAVFNDLTPKKTSRPSTATIKHGLPSPPTTIGSSNGSIRGPKPKDKQQTDVVRSQLGSSGPHEIRVPAGRSENPKSNSNQPSKNPYPRRPQTSGATFPAPSAPPQKSADPPDRPSTRAGNHLFNTRMKPSKRESLPAHTTDYNSFDPHHRGSASLGSKLHQITSPHSNQASISPQTSTISHLNSQTPDSNSRQPSTAHGRMSSRSSNSESTTSTNHHPPESRDSTEKLSTSLISNATIKPDRSPSESSSTELKAAKIKVRDRSKDSSSATVNEDGQNLPRSKRLISMKERNERIFASINASLHSGPRTHPPEPSLPPPPPSTSSSGSSGSPPFSESPKRSSGNLRVPGAHDVRSGLIPFAKGCSPSPRKITSGSQSQAPNGRIDKPSSRSNQLEPDIMEDDEQYGSVRNKRSERSRLVAGNSQVNPMLQPYNEGGEMLDHPDQLRRRIEPKAGQYQNGVADLPTSDVTQSHRNSRTWSESISMHTSSSDTIDARDSRTALRSASRSSAVDSETNSSKHTGASRYWDDVQNDYSDHEEVEQETMTTPVKARRSDSFQKTLRNASSISEMLNTRDVHDQAAPSHRAQRVSLGHRRRSSSLTDEGILLANQSLLEQTPPKLSQIHIQSPQSYRSISRRHRPELPNHFVQPRHSERADSEIISTADIRRLDLHSMSPRSDRSRPPTSLRPRQGIESRPHRHSDTLAIGSERLNGVESSLSRYDGHHLRSGTTRHQSVRNKHATWSGLDEVGGDLVRSQSVLGGVYDPRTAERRGTTNNTGNLFPSPTSRRTIVYHSNGADDDDDGQTPTTAYTNLHSAPHKTGSTGSRSRTSEWASEDQDNQPRPVRAGSRAGVHASSLIMSPSQRKTIVERTLRGNVGAAVPSPKPFAPLLRNTYLEKNSPSHHADNRSSSSGASSQLLQQSQRVLGHRLPSSSRLSDNLNRSTRAPTRATSSAAGGLTALLSPTPTVDHHRLLISAYEAMDRTRDDCNPVLNELNLALNGLLSSVVRNSCKIDATSAELSQLSLNHQVEMELVDDGIDSQAEEHEYHPSREPLSGKVTKQKYQMMKDNLAHMSKVQGQLARSSNDQIRDLTEVLICLSKLQRSQKEHSGTRQQPSRVSGSDDTREDIDLYRPGSRASKKYSHSHSPSKLRHPLDLSSSNDESPLSRAKPSGTNDPLRRSVNHHSTPGVVPTNGIGPQHNRASTISFAHNRELSFDGVNYQQVRAKNRTSAMSSTSIRQMGESFYHASNGASSQSRRNEPDVMDDVDEFGLYHKSSEHTLRSPTEPKARHPRPDSAWSRAESHTGHTVRGSQSNVMFPKTPPRLPTSSISQTNAHSNVSPTCPALNYVESRPQRSETNSSHILRHQSSMSKIIDRANSVLSRVEQYPVVSTLPAGRKQTQEAWVRCSRDSSIDESVASSRREDSMTYSTQQQLNHQIDEFGNSESQQEISRRQGGYRRGQATAALERLSRLGSRSRAGNNHEDEDPDQINQMRRSSTSSYLASGPESDGLEEDPRRHRPFVPKHSPNDHSIEPSLSNLSLQNQNQNRDHDQNRNPNQNQNQTNSNSNGNSNNNSHGSNHNRRRRKGSIQTLFGGLKRSTQAKRLS